MTLFRLEPHLPWKICKSSFGSWLALDLLLAQSLLLLLLLMLVVVVLLLLLMLMLVVVVLLLLLVVLVVVVLAVVSSCSTTFAMPEKGIWSWSVLLCLNCFFICTPHS